MTGRNSCPPPWAVALERLIQALSQRRTALAGAVLPFNDAKLVQLQPPTVGAGLTVIAEISVEGGSVRFTTDGQEPKNITFYGHRQGDGSRIELESSSEVTNFRLVGLPGESGTLYVEYFSVPSLGLANA